MVEKRLEWWRREWSGEDKARQGKTRQGKTRQEKGAITDNKKDNNLRSDAK